MHWTERKRQKVEKLFWKRILLTYSDLVSIPWKKSVGVIQHKAIQYHVHIHIYVGRCKKKQIKVNFASILPNYYFFRYVHTYVYCRNEVMYCIKVENSSQKEELKKKKKKLMLYKFVSEITSYVKLGTSFNCNFNFLQKTKINTTQLE